MTAEKTEERVHHPYSPSTLQNLEACPCYRSSGEANERAIAGTMAHKVAETGEDDMELGDDDAVAVAECLDFVEQRRRLMLEERDRTQDALAKLGWSPGRIAKECQVTELKECYLPIDDCKFEDCNATTAGYMDHTLIACSQVYAEMFDWKFGKWPVEKADNNLQGIAYVIGMFKRMPKLQTIRFFFKQPHINYVTDATITRESIGPLYLRIQVVVAKAREARKLTAMDDWSMANPTVPVCNFCSEIGKCHKVRNLAIKVAQKFHPTAFPASISAGDIMDPKNTRMALELAATVKVWAEAFRRQVTNRVINGGAEVPEGYRLKNGSGRRKIMDLPKFKEISLKYIPEKVYADSLDASFGPIEDAISDAAPRGQKTKEVERFQKELLDSGAVAKGEGYTFLAASSEK